MEGEASPGTAPRARIEARTAAWMIEQRARLRALELENARLAGELGASERIERAAQRYADKLEERLAEARRREASLARAVGYLEAQRDQLRLQLGKKPSRTLPELVEFEIEPAERPRRAPEARARAGRRA